MTRCHLCGVTVRHAVVKLNGVPCCRACMRAVIGLPVDLKIEPLSTARERLRAVVP